MLKSKLLFLAFILSGLPAFCQKSVTTKEFTFGERRRGYVGFSVGPSLPTGLYNEARTGNAGMGIHANLNSSYLFTGHFGMGAKLLAGQNPNNSRLGRLKFKPWRYAGIMAGPVYSTWASRTLEVAFQPMIGYARTELSQLDTASIAQVTTGSFAFNISANLQYNFASRWGAHLGFDFFQTKAKFGEGIPHQPISIFTPSLGLAYRFR